MKIHRCAPVLLFLLCLTPAAHAQQRPVLSPRDSITLTLDTTAISVNYSRPSMRGRKIMGALVPWDKVWRTGANLATHLRTSFDMVMGGVPVPRGTYTLWTIPSPTTWTIVLNKQTGQWGTNYDERQDLARFEARTETLPSPVDTFTIALQAAGKQGGLLKLLWENTSVTIPFERNDRIRPISPLDSVETKVKGKTVKIKYSRPFIRGRAVWGVVVPFDSVWRTGANLTTTLTTEVGLRIGKCLIPPGSYTLYSLPTANGFTLIVSKKPAGFPAYDPTMDACRIPMEAERAPVSVDPFRIWFAKSKTGLMLKLGWADRVYRTTLAGK
jgi:hypothetical protein